MDTHPHVFQEFKSKDNKSLESLSTHSEENGDRYILWSDIQLAFKAIDSLSLALRKSVLFMIDVDAVREPLCVK